MGDRRITRIFLYLLIVVVFVFVILATFSAPDGISGKHLSYLFSGVFVITNLVLMALVLMLWLRKIRE